MSPRQAVCPSRLGLKVVGLHTLVTQSPVYCRATSRQSLALTLSPTDNLGVPYRAQRECLWSVGGSCSTWRGEEVQTPKTPWIEPNRTSLLWADSANRCTTVLHRGARNAPAGWATRFLHYTVKYVHMQKTEQFDIIHCAALKPDAFSSSLQGAQQQVVLRVWFVQGFTSNALLVQQKNCSLWKVNLEKWKPFWISEWPTPLSKEWLSKSICAKFHASNTRIWMILLKYAIIRCTIPYTTLRFVQVWRP